jgi:hypothetical protein
MTEQHTNGSGVRAWKKEVVWCFALGTSTTFCRRFSSSKEYQPTGCSRFFDGTCLQVFRLQPRVRFQSPCQPLSNPPGVLSSAADLTDAETEGPDDSVLRRGSCVGTPDHAEAST